MPLLLFLLPLLLLLPVLYYSLTTPFALVDDYGQCYYVEFLDNSKRFFGWFKKNILNANYGRYRPFFDLYNMVTWKAFGPTPWLHHLCRWMLHFTSILFFALAYCKAINVTSKPEAVNNTPNSSKLHYFLPLSFLLYIWMFFPNSPVSRLGPQEVFTVFFFGLCNWMLVLLMRPSTNANHSVFRFLQLMVFYIACLGLAISKEINIAPLLWITFFWCVWLAWKRSWKSLYLGLPLILLCTHTMYRVYIASKGHYGTASVTFDLLMNNVLWISRELFLLYTSPIITWGFSLVLISFVLFFILRLVKNETDTEGLYILFLVGQFLSLFAMISTSWAQVLRYWYPLIPILATLLAFGIKYLLSCPPAKHQIVKIPLQAMFLSFLLFFIGVNYYNFVLQTVVQHSIRTAEAALIDELKGLQNKGEHIQILLKQNDPEAELVYHLRDYFNRFSTKFYQEKYHVSLNKPKQSGSTYFTVTMHEQPSPIKLHKKIENKRDYQILNKTKQLSSFLQQATEPYFGKDAGVHYLDDYQWYIYQNQR